MLTRMPKKNTIYYYVHSGQTTIKVFDADYGRGVPKEIINRRHIFPLSTDHKTVFFSETILIETMLIFSIKLIKICQKDSKMLISYYKCYKNYQLSIGSH